MRDVAFLQMLDAVKFARERLGFEPDERQATVLDHSIRRGLLNCTRQWGKSTITALKAVHWGYSRPGSHVLMASATSAQVGEFLEKAREFLADLGIKEAAEVSDASYRTLRPMTAAAASGSLWLMSTPAGKRGFFYEAWFYIGVDLRAGTGSHSDHGN